MNLEEGVKLLARILRDIRNILLASAMGDDEKLKAIAARLEEGSTASVKERKK